jgi:hypothetical protein
MTLQLFVVHAKHDTLGDPNNLAVHSANRARLSACLSINARDTDN